MATNLSTQLPHDNDCERALIGSVLIHPSIFPELNIESDDFYNVFHRDIWQSFETIHAEGRDIDQITVATELRRKKIQPKDIIYLSEIVAGTYTSTYAESYADDIREKSRRRKIINIVSEMAKTAFDTNEDLNASLPLYIEKIVNTSSSPQGAKHIASILSRLYDQVQARAENKEDIWGIPTGFGTLDRYMGGVQKGEIWLLMGKPGVGKSILAMQIAANMASHKPGAIYSMEMNDLSITRRLVSGQTEISTKALKTGNLQEGEMGKFVGGIEHFEKLPLYISDSAGWTTTSLRADLARLKALYKIEWFVLDYLYLLCDGMGENETERTAVMSSGLKRIVRDLDLGSVIVHSMNKEGIANTKTPNQSHTRGSGQVIYDADIATFLTEYDPLNGEDKIPADQRKNIRVLYFAKGRELEEDKKKILLIKRPGFPAFGEYQPEFKIQPVEWWNK